MLLKRIIAQQRPRQLNTKHQKRVQTIITTKSKQIINLLVHNIITKSHNKIMLMMAMADVIITVIHKTKTVVSTIITGTTATIVIIDAARKIKDVIVIITSIAQHQQYVRINHYQKS